MKEYNIRIKKALESEDNYSFYATKLAEKYFDESYADSVFYKKYNQLLKVYYSIAKSRVNEIIKNGHPIFEIIVTDSETNLAIFKASFTIASVGSGLHIPEILFSKKDLDESLKKDVNNKVLQFLEEYSFLNNISSISVEYFDGDAAYQEAILDAGFTLHFDDDDYNTSTHIAYKKVLIKDGPDAGNNSSKQRRRINK